VMEIDAFKIGTPSFYSISKIFSSKRQQQE